MSAGGTHIVAVHISPMVPTSAPAVPA